MEGLDNIRLPFVGAEPGVRTFTEDDIKETADKDLKALKLRMNGLKLYETFDVKGRSGRGEVCRVRHTAQAY